MAIYGNYGYIVSHGNYPEPGLLYVINISNNKILHSRNTVGTYPNSIIISGNGKFAYVTNSSESTVSIFDTSNPLANPIPLIKNIELGNSTTPCYAAISGNYIYVANSANGTVSVINATTNSVTNIPSGISPNYIAFSGNYGYVTDQG
jgi:YVTN family beta-propeller protein